MFITTPALDDPSPWGQPDYDHCVQHYSWSELLQGLQSQTISYKTGGLGALLEVRGYKTGQCSRDHGCVCVCE